MGVCDVAAILFDLGNVVVRIDFARVLESWARSSDSDISDLRARFAFDEAYQAHERGLITGRAYHEHLCHALQITLSYEHFVSGWNAVFLGPMPGISELLQDLSKRLPLYAFSNTNALHLTHLEGRYETLFAHFTAVFASHELGARKPEPGAYRAAIERSGVAPERLIFFDDSARNVEAARAVGIGAVQVTDTESIRQALGGL